MTKSPCCEKSFDVVLVRVNSFGKQTVISCNQCQRLWIDTKKVATVAAEVAAEEEKVATSC